MVGRKVVGGWLPGAATLGFVLALLLICQAFILPSGIAQAAAQAVKAPTNPAFLSYMSERQAALAEGRPMAKPAVDGHALGKIPDPIDRSYLLNYPQPPLLYGSIPTSYDLRTHSKVSPIRDQSNCGSCWAHAAIASLESCMLPSRITDFSEEHVIDNSGYDYGVCDGGWDSMSIAYFGRWAGPVPEVQSPYQYLDATQPSPPKNAAAVAQSFHVQHVNIIPATPDSIKPAVMNKGAATIGFYMSNANWNSTYASYYSNTFNSANHEVAIIGWDDNFPKTHFNVQPQANGAYLVKNSWGTNWGQSGYFWMSYYDKSLEPASYVFYNAEATSNYSWIYQYDTLGNMENYGYANATPTVAWMASVYRANSQGKTLNAVSFYAAVPGTQYKIYVYDKVATSGTLYAPVVKPVSGTKKLNALSGTLAAAGYHTIKFKDPISVTGGKNFSIVVKLTTTGYNYPIPVEDASSGYSNRSSTIPGQTYISSDGVNWQDFAVNSAKACLKAFAQ